MAANAEGAVRVEGLRELNRALGKAGVDAADQKELMHEIGMVVVRAAQPPVVTGALEASMRASRTKGKAIVRAGSARVPYAAVQHYGWPAHNIEPKPFLVDALQSRTDEVTEMMDKGMDEILKKNGLK